MDPNRDKLTAAAAGAGPDAAAWLDTARGRLDAGEDLAETLSLLWAMALRKLGDERLGARADPLSTGHGPLPVAHWRRGDAGRVALLMHATDLAPDPAAVVRQVFRHGDESERAAVVAGLSLLPQPEQLKPLALEAGRVNSLALFSALAHHNPYPAAVYDDHEFNQLVLKCLFVGLAMGAVLGLDRRANPQLSRMCLDYHDERLAAGRDVPRDIWLALAPCADATGLRLLARYLSDPDPRHRLHAAEAVSRLRTLPAELADTVAARRRTETDEDILARLGRCRGAIEK